MAPFKKPVELKLQRILLAQGFRIRGAPARAEEPPLIPRWSDGTPKCTQFLDTCDNRLRSRVERYVDMCSNMCSNMYSNTVVVADGNDDELGINAKCKFRWWLFNRRETRWPEKMSILILPCRIWMNISAWTALSVRIINDFKKSSET